MSLAKGFTTTWNVNNRCVMKIMQGAKHNESTIMKEVFAEIHLLQKLKNHLVIFIIDTETQI